MPVGEIIFSGSLIAAIPLALIAGLVAFASPCVLPLVPAYLGYVSGMSTLPSRDDLQARRRLLLGVVLFVIGFAAVFVLFSVAFASLGALLRSWLPLVTQIAGAVVIMMGFVFIGQVSFMQKQFALPIRAATGLGGAPLLGVIFGFGWAPCAGPTLVAVNTLALSVGDIPRAVILALVYSLGLGIPFVLLAMGVQFATKSMSVVKKHLRSINIAGGAFLMAIGVAMVFGWWTAWMSQLQVWISGSLTIL